MTALPAFALPEHFGYLERILAVVGGAAIGGLFFGFLAQVLVRLLTAQKLPRIPLNIIRLLGAILSGWLVALVVLGGGGSGFGGPGGPGVGGDTGASKDKPPETNGKEKETPREKDQGKDGKRGSLQVEVLGNEPLKKIARDAAPDLERRYRTGDEVGAKLLNLAELKEYIKQRLGQEPPLRQLVLVFYKDSPDPEGLRLRQGLLDWVADLKVPGKEEKVELTFELQRTRNAPVR
jgi:hypothetical protein